MHDMFQLGILFCDIVVLTGFHFLEKIIKNIVKKYLGDFSSLEKDYNNIIKSSILKSILKVSDKSENICWSFLEHCSKWVESVSVWVVLAYLYKGAGGV